MNDDAETQMSMEANPEEGQGDDSMDELENMPSELHAEHEALALQFKAKQKMAEVRKIRNFYKKNDGDSRKTKAGKCFVCGEPGHFAKDCLKVKMSQGQDGFGARQSSARGHCSASGYLSRGWQRVVSFSFPGRVPFVS